MRLPLIVTLLLVAMNWTCAAYAEDWWFDIGELATFSTIAKFEDPHASLEIKCDNQSASVTLRREGAGWPGWGQVAPSITLGGSTQVLTVDGDDYSLSGQSAVTFINELFDGRENARAISVGATGLRSISFKVLPDEIKGPLAVLMGGCGMKAFGSEDDTPTWQHASQDSEVVWSPFSTDGALTFFCYSSGKGLLYAKYPDQAALERLTGPLRLEIEGSGGVAVLDAALRRGTAWVYPSSNFVPALKVLGTSKGALAVRLHSEGAQSSSALKFFVESQGLAVALNQGLSACGLEPVSQTEPELVSPSEPEPVDLSSAPTPPTSEKDPLDAVPANTWMEIANEANFVASAIRSDGWELIFTCEDGAFRAAVGFPAGVDPAFSDDIAIQLSADRVDMRLTIDDLVWPSDRRGFVVYSEGAGAVETANLFAVTSRPIRMSVTPQAAQSPKFTTSFTAKGSSAAINKVLRACK